MEKDTHCAYCGKPLEPDEADIGHWCFDCLEKEAEKERKAEIETMEELKRKGEW